VARHPHGDGLQQYLPRCYDDDLPAPLLVLELQPASRDMWDHDEHARHSSIRLARHMGRALAALHELTMPEEADAWRGERFAADAPWILSAFQPDLGTLCGISAANLKLIQAIQHHAGFAESLERLLLTWKKDRLVHFDMKAENVIILGSPSAGWTRVRLVDWELVGVGDACWDVGSVFADHLGRWMLSMPPIEAHASERLHELNGRRLTRIQRALQAFWKEYIRRMPLRADYDQWLLRSVEYAAARLLQRGYEQLQTSVDFSPASIRFLQVSQHMLQRPEEAAIRLLGLPLHLAAV
jgi:thiamine kinase-like enzyme